MKDFFRKYWKSLSIAFIVLVLTVVFAGPPLLHLIIKDKIGSALSGFGRRTGLLTDVGGISFPTNTSLMLTDVSVRPDSSMNAIVRINRLAVEFYLGGFMTGNYVRRIMVDSLYIRVIRESDSSFNFSRPTESSPDTVRRRLPASAPQNRIARFIDRYLSRKIPSFEVSHLFGEYSEPYKRNIHDRENLIFKDFSVTLKESFFRDAQLEVRGTIEQDDRINYMISDGTLNHRSQKIQVSTFFNAPFRIPGVSSRLHGDAFLKGVDLEVHSLFDEGERSQLKASLNLIDVEIESEAVADEKLKNINVGFDLDLDYGLTDIEIKPATKVYLNKIQTFLAGRIDHLDDEPRLDVTATISPLSMDDFLASIPNALMTRIDGMKVRGSFDFKARLQLDLALLDSTKYDVDVHVSDDFRVLSLGDSIDIIHLRDTFQYEFLTEEEQDSTFWVGPMNPYYVPLDSLPAVLVNSILYCEDNSFFKNDGFNTLQIGRSIRDNLRAGKFARGASTISMQWTKNIYLSREKTIARKFQELILTWLINHEKLLDKAREKEAHKKRLLEIYLNIIEWGPDIRGIGRASQFYFKKRPKDLTVDEAVFLATIIPNPKKYERYFEGGQLIRKHRQFMEWVVRMLEQKDVIDSTLLLKSLPVSFQVVGEARKLISGYKNADSLDIEDDIEYRQSIME